MSDMMVTMVFTDLVSSTAIKKHLPGNDISERNRLYFETILKPHRQRVKAQIEEFAGRIVKSEGDAYFVVFGNAANAARWAVGLQKTHLESPIATPLGALQVKIGMHTGSPLQDGDDFIGQEVDFAARLCASAIGGEILLSEVTAVLVRSAQITGFAVHYRGERDLKGIGAVPIFELIYGGKSVRGPIDKSARQKELDESVEHTLIPVVDPPPRSLRRSLGMILGTSMAATVAIVGLRLLGVLQAVELKVLDQFIRLRPPEGIDQRILVVKATEADFQQLREYPLSDRTLLKVLTKLESYQPAVIGLDIYRDIPQGEGQVDLLKYLQQSDRLVVVCKVPESNTAADTGVAPPTGFPEERLGFSDVIVDPDQVLRRQLLNLTPPPISTCTAQNSLNLQLATRYLASQNIPIQVTPEGYWQMGDVVFRRLRSYTGAYQRIDTADYQIMLNYRAPLEVGEQVTLGEVLAGKIRPEAIKDKVVLVGVDREGIDRYTTPFSGGHEENRSIAGVFLQAQMVSHILSAVLDRRPLLHPWSFGMEIGWIWGWSLVVGAFVWWFRKLWVPVVLVGALLITGLSFMLFLQSVWVPVLPAIFGIFLTAIGLLAFPTFFWRK